jgi:Zn finger protein HypA/HybF involved in hydrogenase expression
VSEEDGDEEQIVLMSTVTTRQALKVITTMKSALKSESSKADAEEKQRQLHCQQANYYEDLYRSALPHFEATQHSDKQLTVAMVDFRSMLAQLQDIEAQTRKAEEASRDQMQERKKKAALLGQIKKDIERVRKDGIKVWRLPLADGKNPPPQKCIMYNAFLTKLKSTGEYGVVLQELGFVRVKNKKPEVAATLSVPTTRLHTGTGRGAFIDPRCLPALKWIKGRLGDQIVESCATTLEVLEGGKIVTIDLICTTTKDFGVWSRSARLILRALTIRQRKKETSKPAPPPPTYEPMTPRTIQWAPGDDSPSVFCAQCNAVTSDQRDRYCKRCGNELGAFASASPPRTRTMRTGTDTDVRSPNITPSTHTLWCPECDQASGSLELNDKLCFDCGADLQPRANADVVANRRLRALSTVLDDNLDMTFSVPLFPERQPTSTPSAGVTA